MVFSQLKYYVAKVVRKSRPPALLNCNIDPTSKIHSGSQLVSVSMGKYSYCAYNCQLVNCTIGAFCSISDNVMIGRAEHPLGHVSTSPTFLLGANSLKKNFANNEFNGLAPTQIGNDVWIGFGAMIKAGVTIGDGAVIGMGSVVTKNIPAYGIWGGNPAREIRKRFDSETIDRLVESKWWEMNDSELDRLGSQFSDPSSAILL